MTKGSTKTTEGDGEQKPFTNGDVLTLFQHLGTLANLVGAKFSYAISKNFNILQDEVKSLSESIQPSEEYKNGFDKERMELLNKLGKKDDAGKLIVVGDENVLEDQAAFDLEYAELRKKYKEVVDKYDATLKEFEALKKEPSSVTLFKINIADVPENITVAQLHGISALIIE